MEPNNQGSKAFPHKKIVYPKNYDPAQRRPPGQVIRNSADKFAKKTDDQKFGKPFDPQNINFDDPESITEVGKRFYMPSFMEDPWEQLTKKEKK